MPSRSLLVVPSLLALLLACDSQPSKPVAKQADPAAEPQAQAQTADEAAKTKQAAEQHTLKALELEAAGRLVEARTEVELALAGGAGRDAQLLAAKLAILRDDLDVAARLLEPLAADGKDSLVLYNLGLIAQRRGTYNPARTHYLAALKADPTYAPARYNLALLTWEAGIKEEAKHHAQKFIELSPGDPRAADLRAKVELDVQPAPAGPPTTPSPTPEPTARPVDLGLKDPFAKR